MISIEVGAFDILTNQMMTVKWWRYGVIEYYKNHIFQRIHIKMNQLKYT